MIGRFLATLPYFVGLRAKRVLRVRYQRQKLVDRRLIQFNTVACVYSPLIIDCMADPIYIIQISVDQCQE
jgi:hypothetical protein